MVFIPTSNQFPRDTVQDRGTASNVPTNTLTTILSYTNTGSEVLYLDKIVFEGQAAGCFEYVLDTTIQAVFRTTGSKLGDQADFPVPLKIAAGSIIDIKVTHNFSATADFSASIFGHRR